VVALVIRPMVRIALLMPDDSVICRDYYVLVDGAKPMEWCNEDGLIGSEYGPPIPLGSNAKPAPRPAFINDPFRAWDHPQDPITFGGTVKPGTVGTARQWIGFAEPERVKIEVERKLPEHPSVPIIEATDGAGRHGAVG
jgi:hypothetical protein